MARGTCWVGYEQKGMKKKGDRMVPNCVKAMKKGDPIISIRLFLLFVL
jgi:hypothetical protein